MISAREPTLGGQPQSDASARGDRNGRQVLGAVAAVVSVSVPPFLVGALTTRIGRDLDFGTADLGLALAACYAITAALSPLAGRFVRRFGAEVALRIACGLTTVGLLGIATASSAQQVVWSVAFVGAPNALTQPSSNEMLAHLKRPRMRAFSFGLVQASIPTATLIAGAVLAVASYSTGWRGSVLTVAAFTVGAQLVLPRSRPHAHSPRRSAPRPTRSVPDRLPGGPALMIGIVMTGGFASASATALPSFAATTGLAFGTAAWLVAGAQMAGSLGSIVVRVAAPVVASHANLSQCLHIVAGLQLLGLLSMLGIATGSPIGFVVASITAFAFGWGWNGLFNLIVTLARPGRIAAATGLSQAGVFAGGTLGPLIFAVIARDEHFSAGWIVMAAVMAVAVLSALFAARRAGELSAAHSY